MKYNYYIGIDPGVNTGFAVWCTSLRSFLFVSRSSILEVMEIVHAFSQMESMTVFVRIEDARQRRWIPKQKNEKAERGRNRGAGSVMRDCQIWEEFCKKHGIAYEMVAPKNNKTKMSAAYFKSISGFGGKTNEHGRDAAALVIGMK